MNELTNTTEPQIAYSECYAQPFSRLFFGDCLIESGEHSRTCEIDIGL